MGIFSKWLTEAPTVTITYQQCGSVGPFVHRTRWYDGKVTEYESHISYCIKVIEYSNGTIKVGLYKILTHCGASLSPEYTAMCTADTLESTVCRLVARFAQENREYYEQLDAEDERRTHAYMKVRDAQKPKEERLKHIIDRCKQR